METIEPAYWGMSHAMKERDIFVAALAITNAEERDAFLDEACSEPGQKEHLQALLEAEAKLGTFLEFAGPSDGVDQRRRAPRYDHWLVQTARADR